MCGICGIIDFKSKTSSKQRQQSVQAMNHAIFHRGPDEEGEYYDRIASLAMRRLSIIDLAGGQQPIFNESKDICIFFNGEIYNFQELRDELLAKGHQFKTNSDTETIVHLYEEIGTDLFARLKGMFALCLYDLRQQKFILGRDRFGEKPLFYHWNGTTFSFSSEIQSLLCHKAIPRRLNHEALPYYFRTSLVPEPLTLFQDIHSLPPAHFVEITEDNISINNYFSIDYKINNDLKTEEDAIAFIQPKLEQAVARQTISDVPIGAFLSGGIDSSTVVALLQKNSSKKISTFNVRFEDEVFDESSIARKVAEFWDTDHHEITIPNYDFTEDVFWTIICHIGVPFRDSSAIPTYFVSKAIGQHVKVALSGDGGDELFAGYSLFQWHEKILTLQKIPKFIRQSSQFSLQLAQHFPVLKNTSKIRQLQRVLNTSFEEKQDIPIALNEFFKAAEIEGLLGIKETYQRLKNYPATAQNWSNLRKVMYYRTVHTLPSNMLIKVDRMSMANSLEVRAPFLDPDLFDAAAQLPDPFLIKNGKGKHLIRKIMEKDLPSEVFNHPKKGFSIPLYKYQNEAFKKLAQRLLFEENPLPNLFERTFLERIYHQGLTQKKNTAQQSVFQASHRLWMVMQLLGWAEVFGVGE
ncbi:MAG: asparagine synthase (glutamine-hydrolyzing) [Bacteroidota bacterium]